MFYYISVDELGKITSTVKSITELNPCESLVSVSEIVDIHNKEGKEYFYDRSKGTIYFEYNLEAVKTIAWDKCKEYYSDSLNQGFLYKGVVYDSTDEARSSILNTRLAGIDVYWTAYDNSVHFFTAEEFSEFHKSLTTWISGRHNDMQTIRNRINSSASAEEIRTVLDSFNIGSIS